MKPYLYALLGIFLVGSCWADDDPQWKTLDDKTIALSEGSYELVFLDALCPMPHFPDCERVVERLSQRSPEKVGDTVLVFNTLYVDSQAIADFVENHGLSMPIVVDKTMTLHDRFGVYATPYRVVLTDGAVTEKGRATP